MNIATKPYKKSPSVSVGVSFLPMLTVIALLAGCDQQSTPETSSVGNTATAVRSQVPTAADKQDEQHIAGGQTGSAVPETEEPMTTAGSNNVEEPEKKQAKKKLDLKLSEADMVLGEGSQAANQNQVLPNMFHEKKQGTKVGGGIIRDEENENYVDSIQGAKLNVEFQTD